MPSLVLFNTAWMTRYRGQTATDRLVNGGQWVTDNEDGGEAWNFQPTKGSCYGYVRTPRGGALNLSRIAANGGGESLAGVTVVFTARRPGGGSVVVGWYRNARVSRDSQLITARGPRHRWEYRAAAKVRDCVLLAPDERVFPVPRARGHAWGLGQSNVRYVDEPAAKSFVRNLCAYINNPKTTPIEAVETPRTEVGKRGAPRQPNPLLRAKVEKAAVEYVTSHFKKLGYKCSSVEGDNVGWDIEATRGAARLLVEVKGCSGAEPIVELTPNEYGQMRGVHQVAYRLAIVTHALRGPRAHLVIVSFNLSDGTWCDEDGRPARLTERTGVRITI